MRPSSCKILWLLAAAGLVALVALSQRAAADQAPAQSAREALKISDMMSFETFKQRFHKHYDSLVTALARQKLFFARAFRAIISAINYKRGARGSYLAINDFSDWTPVEYRKILINLTAEDEVKPRDEAKLDSEAGPALEAIESEAKVLGEHRDEILSELAKANAEADRKSADKRDATVEKLVLSAADASQSADAVGRKPEPVNLKSNNPEYQKPELMSEGADDDDTPNAHMPVEQAGFISRLPGFNLLGQAAGAVYSWATQAGADEDDYEDDYEDAADDMEVDGVPTSGGARHAPTLPDVVYHDYRRTGCLNEVRSQGNCGSCYIFSAVALYEYAYCMDTGYLSSMSEQYIIDCGGRANLEGCEGGHPWKVSDFVRDYGLEMRATYPYRTKQDTCPYSEDQRRTMGFLRAHRPEMTKIRDTDFEQYIKLGPFNFNMFLPDGFSEYGGGVLECNHDKTENGHAMVAIGSGRENGEEYWLVRNSHGVWWGEQGHLKVSKKNTCTARISHAVLDATVESRSFFRKENERYDAKPVAERYVAYMSS